ncbi:ABC transporter permease [Paracoccus jiaweipingae]|uniref:ABC transporter permease n=1 Tax=unclassified Paracoccus (in: a-proteobacteria) TaxID=2688777 RepID=UPI0037B586AF
MLAALILASLLVGSAGIGLPASGDAGAMLVMMESRLPRTLATLLTGAALAVSGVIIQSLVRNRFVGPETSGGPESAALGLMLVTLLAPQAPIWVKMAVASLSAMGGTALFLALIRRLPPQEVLLIPITGLVLSGVIGALVTWIGWQADMVQYVITWLMTGEFSGVVAGRYELLWIAGAAAALSWFVADRFAILALGEGMATGLGLSTRWVMRLGLVVVAVVSALVVVTVGMIPFVGLVVPNIVSRLMGDNLRRSLPVVALAGAGLVLGCDLIGRLLVWPYEIPVGTILGVVGAVLFLWLLHRRPAHVQAHV